MLTPQMKNGITGGKLPSNSEFLTPMAIYKDMSRPLHKDLIFDARDDPMNTPSIMNMQPAYQFHDTNEPCIGSTRLAGMTNLRTHPRNNVPDTFGMYPQPKAGTRDKVFGLAHCKQDIENSNNKILRKHNNFNIHADPPFKPFVRSEL